MKYLILLVALLHCYVALKTPFIDNAEIEGEFVGIELDAGIEKDLSELPAEAAQELGYYNTDIYATQPKVIVPSPTPSVAKIPLRPNEIIQPVDRSGRSIETRLDLRPATAGMKKLVGQVYSANYNLTADFRDPDGFCRNSRGDIVECAVYGKTTVPPIMESLDDIVKSRVDWTPPGPCVLKCLYHKGISTSVGNINTETISIEIPTLTAVNNTFACPKTNNGYPFISCSLLLDESDKCVSTCVFDGDANPLKPREFAIGKTLSGPKGFQFDPADFKSYLFSTYQVKTKSGCKSSMRADPLVACEVQL
eukprot:c7348_g1_i2.p1 GENE.c7348_g1_i2~~c7348_g1_i2.p1  ORF type:complete len:320 (+),score=139.40 c7348_g1_i2:38-961(+)